MTLALFLLLTSAVSADDSNGDAGGEGTHTAATTGYYLSGQWGWKVSLFVAKDIGLTNDEYKSLSLLNDYNCIGSIIMKKRQFTLPYQTFVGTKNKIDYFSDPTLQPVNHFTYWDYDCPAPPACCYGNINTVNSYFLNNKLVLDVLEKIAVEKGVSGPERLLSGLRFYWHHEVDGKEVVDERTTEDLGYRNVVPMSDRSNYVPWVIVYEPMICTYLAEGGAVFFTATEYALSQGKLWNWNWSDNPQCYFWGNWYDTGRLRPQAVQGLTFRSLPMSVMLNESWFGYPKGIIPGENQSLDLKYIVDNGGWGMGYLSPMPYDELEKHMKTEIDLGVYSILPNAPYRTGTEVVSGFDLINYTDGFDVRPDHGIGVKFSVTDETTGIILSEQTWNGVALPSYEATVIWFRWKVTAPEGHVIRCMAETVLPDSFTDSDPNDNTDGFKRAASPEIYSRTETEGYASAIPDGFSEPSAGADYSETASWTEWNYDGDFYAVTYTVSSDGCRAEIVPDSGITSTRLKNDVWKVRSGYGFTLDASNELSFPGGYEAPDGSVTLAQSCIVLFPENGYGAGAGQYDSTEADGNSFGFFVNDTAIDGDRLHYIPLWYPDTPQSVSSGSYAVCAVFSDIWTPIGMICASVYSNALVIEGSMYDDWRVSRSQR